MSEAQSGDALTLLLAGDVYVQRSDPERVFRFIEPVLAGADAVFGNLEGAYADGGTPWPKGGINVWKADAAQMAAIKAGRFAAMSSANNHIMDFGHDGLLETLENLKRIGVKHAGAGRNRAEAHAPAIIERNGVRIALLAYTSVYTPGWEATDDRPGLAVLGATTAYEPPLRFRENPGKPPRVRTWLLPEARERIAQDLAETRTRADIVVCSFHWGVSEGHSALVDYQVELAHLAVENGADLVFGHHPHLIQGIEVYKGVPVFYSLGNLTFARHNGKRGHELETMLVKCEVRNKRIQRVSYIPVLSDESLCPQILPLADAGPVTSLVEERSGAFGTLFTARADEGVVVVLEHA